jgi:hypothetical protein
VGDGSPGSREAEGEGGKGFYTAQSGRCPDLLVIWGRDHCEYSSCRQNVRLQLVLYLVKYGSIESSCHADRTQRRFSSKDPVAREGRQNAEDDDVCESGRCTVEAISDHVSCSGSMSLSHRTLEII